MDWLALQPELLVIVGTHCATAADLLAMGAACRTWRHVLRTDEATWKVLPKHRKHRNLL